MYTICISFLSSILFIFIIYKTFWFNKSDETKQLTWSFFSFELIFVKKKFHSFCYISICLFFHLFTDYFVGVFFSFLRLHRLKILQFMLYFLLYTFFSWVIIRIRTVVVVYANNNNKFSDIYISFFSLFTFQFVHHIKLFRYI